MPESDLEKNQAQNQEYIQNLQKQLKLQDTGAFYYSLVENIPQCIFCKDLDGRFTFVNQLFCRMLEKPIEEIIGKNDFDFYPRELARKYREDDQRVIEENRTFDDVEENKVSFHETKYVHVIKTPIHDANGSIIGIQGVFWDITKRKQAEDELENANERMRHDLMAAAKVQRRFIPDSPPRIPGFRFSWLFEPSEYVGGDILNIIRLDEKRWAFYVLDVSGHGVAAALLSVSLTRMIDQTSITISSMKGNNVSLKASDELLDPKKVIHKLNRRFPGDNTKFCTLLYAILDTEESSVTWIRAGHVPPLWIQDHGARACYLHEPEGIFISNLPYNDSYLQTKKIQLAPGDRFVLFSDGITEAMKDKQEFGYDKFEQVMLGAASSPLDQSVQSVLRSLSDWTGSSKFDDDVTLLALEKTSDGH